MQTMLYKRLTRDGSIISSDGVARGIYRKCRAVTAYKALFIWLVAMQPGLYTIYSQNSRYLCVNYHMKKTIACVRAASGQPLGHRLTVYYILDSKPNSWRVTLAMSDWQENYVLAEHAVYLLLCLIAVF